MLLCWNMALCLLSAWQKSGPKLLGSAPSTLVKQALVMMSRHISGRTENGGSKGTVFCVRF